MDKPICTYPDCDCFSIKNSVPGFPGPQPGCPRGLKWNQPVDNDLKGVRQWKDN